MKTSQLKKAPRGKWFYIQAIEGMKLDDNGGFGPFRSDPTKEAGELDEDVDKRNSCS